MTEFKTYPKIKRIGHEQNAGMLESGHLVVKEKLDGANFRFKYDSTEDRIVFGSRNIEYWNEKDTDKNFTHAVDFVRDTTSAHEIAFSDPGGSYTFFGEAMHAHTLDYRWDEVPSFLGFDIYDSTEGVFLDWTKAKELFDRLELPTVPIRYTGSATEYELPDTIGSEYRNGEAEGVVLRNEDSGQTGKYRTERFKEAHSAQYVTDPDEYKPSDSVVLARQFTTEARVLKQIHKYEDRGREIEMSIMEDLWRDVFDDVVEEEYETILLGNHTLNTKEFRSEVASLTANVLEAYIKRPDESVLNEPE